MKITMKKKSKIPQFKNRNEEAKFFETHSIASFQDEFKEVKVRFAKNLSEGIHVRLDPNTLATLRREAHEKGVGPTTLARMWIMEQLRSSQR